MGFFDGGVVASNACLTIQDATLFEFAILTSRMHMDWLRTVGGRLKSDVRYSKDVVYNNFVFPTVMDSQRAILEQLAQRVLDARAAHPTDTLADLYDPNVMPANLAAAHRALTQPWIRHTDTQGLNRRHKGSTICSPCGARRRRPGPPPHDSRRTRAPRRSRIWREVISPVPASGDVRLGIG